MSRLIDADALLSMVKPIVEDDALRTCTIETTKKIIYNLITDAPTADAVTWEFLEEYAEWFSAMVSFPEFIREAKQFYLDAERYERWCNK